MKRKYQGLASICMVLAAVIASIIYYGLTVSGATENGSQVVRRAPNGDTDIPGPDAVKAMMAASTTLAGLANPPEADPTPCDLSLFGQPARLNGPPGSTQGFSHASSIKSVDYSVSLAFSSGSKRFCIVDGELYKEQSDLPQGGRILEIESKRILVDKHGVHKWIAVDGSGGTDHTGTKKRTLAQNTKSDSPSP